MRALIHRIHAGPYPLTEFLVKLHGYRDEDLRKASAAKAVRRYGIKKEHAAGYIRLAQQMRGIVAKNETTRRVCKAGGQRGTHP